jgi:hypothetical protein
LNAERLKIFFAPHMPEAFTARFHELFGWCQVLALEHAYETEVDAKEAEWNDAAQSIEEYQANLLSPFFPFTERLAGIIYDSKKTVVLERSPITEKESKDTYSLFTNARTCWKRAQFEEAKRLLSQYLKDFGTECYRRDQSYAGQLKAVLTRFSNQRTLAVRGPMHGDTLPQELGRLGVSFESFQCIADYLPTLQEEATIKLRRGLEISNEELVLIQIEADLTPRAPTYGDMVSTRNRVLAMSSSEVKDYCSKLAEHPIENDSSEASHKFSI